MKLLPWSLWTDFGNPTNVKNLVKAFTILGAFMFLKGIASGNLVEAHMIVNKYSLPVLVLGRGPTQSIITLLNGSSNAGIGFNGALGIFWFGFPTT